MIETIANFWNEYRAAIALVEGVCAAFVLVNAYFEKGIGIFKVVLVFLVFGSVVNLKMTSFNEGKNQRTIKYNSERIRELNEKIEQLELDAAGNRAKMDSSETQQTKSMPVPVFLGGSQNGD